MSPLSIIVSISFFVVVFFSMFLEMRSQKRVTTISKDKENNENNQIRVQKVKKKFEVL